MVIGQVTDLGVDELLAQRLIGLARALSDDATLCYLQDSRAA